MVNGNSPAVRLSVFRCFNSVLISQEWHNNAYAKSKHYGYLTNKGRDMWIIFPPQVVTQLGRESEGVRAGACVDLQNYYSNVVVR